MKKRSIMNIVYILLLTILIVSVFWIGYMAPKQIEVYNKCEEECLSKGLTYEVKMFSYPIDNLNAECFCVNKTKVEIDIENE